MAAAPAGAVVERFRARLREEEVEVDGEGDGAAAAAVVRVYVEVLSELTFNCKPIITELTIIAGQHAALAARGIADAICARIAEVSADQKLPSLYLLDSIVKNIAREYVGHFAARLQKVFCDAYRKVHRSQHAAMRHLFGTWSQVFPSSVLRGIEDELQFSPLENKRSATVSDIQQSESISPRPPHGIHVNPKYLEAQQQFKHTTSVHQPINRGNRQITDLEEDQVNGLTSKTSRGWPAANSKLQKSAMLYADDLDQQETFRSHTGGPLANSRRTMSRSPPLDVLPRNVSPKRAFERPPLSHSVLGPDPRRLPDRNGWFERPSMSILDEEYRKQSARELIDAYGNSQGKDIDERLPKMQRIDSNGMASRPSAQQWLTSEEEEYTWEDMSPTLTDRNRTDMPPLPLPGAMRAGFPGPNSVLRESDIVRHSWPAQAPRPAIDGPSLNFEDRIPANGLVDRATNRRYPGNFGVQNGALVDYQNSEHTVDPGRTTIPAPPWQQTIGQPLRVQAPQPAILNRKPLPTDSTYDALNVDIPLLEKHRSSPAHAPIEWQPLHTQPQIIHPHDTKHPRGAADSLDSRPFIGQGANSSVFVPQHQYDGLDRRTISTGDAAQPSYQHPDLLSLSQQNQGIVLGNQAQPHHPPQFHPHPHPHLQDTIRSFAPSMSVAPPQNVFQGQGGSAAVPPVPLMSSSFPVPPAVAPYGLPSIPGFPLPPLPSGAPPPSQIGPSSSQVGGPPFVSGLLSNLMQQGVISLQPPNQPQDSVGIDFKNVDLKVRKESVINALYQDLPRQCKTCGLRFKCQEEHRAHMDWHVTKNRNSKNRKQTSRKYFVTVGEWLRAAETVGNDGVPSFEPAEPVADAKEEKELAVPADEDQTACALCQEPFEDFYSDETEEWMYKGAVYMNSPDGNVDGLERTISVG
uniref:CID domain-containing protein n=1 Tax=Leersia perrieri TaxID=77586 RepID=A0A0D9X550_9ORYZ